MAEKKESKLLELKKAEAAKANEKDKKPEPKWGENALKLPKEQREMLYSCFNSFDSEKKGYIVEDIMKSILEMMGLNFTTKEMKVLLAEVDPTETGQIFFEQFIQICGKFMEEESEDTAVIMKELREIFNIYDRERKGFMTCECLRGILLELDPTLKDPQLTEIIEEVDEDGSNSIEFEEFVKMMLG